METTQDPATQPAPTTPFYVTFLWAINLAWTLALFYMTVKEFLLGGQWTYQGPGSLIYFATLGAYAGAKETHNWTVGESTAEARGRKGILFVGVWMAFALTAFVMINVTTGYVFPHELAPITLEVLAIFFGTQASSAIRRGKRKGGPVPSGLEEAVCALLNQEGGLKPGAIAGKLNAQRWDVAYALDKLVKAGRVRKVGKSTRDPNTKYEVVQG